jgi:hypothetical protein
MWLQRQKLTAEQIQTASCLNFAWLEALRTNHRAGSALNGHTWLGLKRALTVDQPDL